MQAKFAKIIGVSVTAMAVLAITVPVFAKSNGTMDNHGKNLVAQARNMCRKTAQQKYTSAIHKANQDYKTARNTARTALKTALKVATDGDARTAAKMAYKQALTTANDEMKLAKQQALANLKTDQQQCRVSTSPTPTPTVSPSMTPTPTP